MSSTTSAAATTAAPAAQENTKAEATSTAAAVEETMASPNKGSLHGFVKISPKKRKTPDSETVNPVEVPAQLSALSKDELVDLCKKLLARMPEGSTIQAKRAKLNDEPTTKQTKLFTYNMPAEKRKTMLTAIFGKLSAAVKEVGHTSTNSPVVEVAEEMAYNDFLGLVGTHEHTKESCTLTADQIIAFIGDADLSPLIHPVKFTESTLSFGADKKAETPYCWSYMKELTMTFTEKKLNCKLTVGMAGAGKPGSFRANKNLSVDSAVFNKFVTAEQ